jgi:hypothetical protein
MKTQIHWMQWLPSETEFETKDLRDLVHLARKYPDAELLHADDSIGDSFLVFASGDLSSNAITKGLDSLGGLTHSEAE